ncbi:MAG: pyridoxamine 5'-phosphate oxidase family protein [Deltaproteobacteria bacterium]|nr:pyridoxamine 5'-phosphate oxidase family protein [Deltaproteobacteria bacterium]
MDREERKAFVRAHRTCVFGYNRRYDGPSMSIVYYMMDGPDDLLISTMAERAKAKAVQHNSKVSIMVLDEKWPPTYVQLYCDARVDATMESDPARVIDSMMTLYALMAGEQMPESARANAAQTAEREQRIILRLKPYATFETPPRHVYKEQDTIGLTHWLGQLLPW